MAGGINGGHHWRAFDCQGIDGADNSNLKPPNATDHFLRPLVSKWHSRARAHGQPSLRRPSWLTQWHLLLEAENGYMPSHDRTGGMAERAIGAQGPARR